MLTHSSIYEFSANDKKKIDGTQGTENDTRSPKDSKPNQNQTNRNKKEKLKKKTERILSMFILYFDDLKDDNDIHNNNTNTVK